MKKNTINILFVLGVFIFLLAGLFKTVLFPTEINTYENRKAELLMKPSLSSFLDGTLQDNVEAAVTDQAFFSSLMKRAYNSAKSEFMMLAVSPVSEKYPDKYIRMGTYYLYNKDKLIFAPYDLSYAADEMQAKCDYFNGLFKKYPDTDFYLYYIEKDTDIVFVDNCKVGAFEYFKERIDIPDEKFKRFEITSFEEFDKYFFSTDHHWNLEGSHKGYKEVVRLLSPNEASFIEPRGKVRVGDEFKGSKTLTEETSAFSEKFVVNEFSYPEMDIYINGALADDYGNQAEFTEGTDRPLSYGEFYGGDEGEIIFDTGNRDKENLLVVGESFDNAILKLVASHFNRTVSVDMRYYKDYMGTDFDFNECLKANDIDKVLFIGNIDYFVSDAFNVEK